MGLCVVPCTENQMTSVPLVAHTYGACMDPGTVRSPESRIVQSTITGKRSYNSDGIVHRMVHSYYDCHRKPNLECAM